MRITADTNLLVRLFVSDDPQQTAVATDTLAASEIIALPTAVLCELVWVLRRVYRLQADEILEPLRKLLSMSQVRTDRVVVEAGLMMLAAGGEFADGVLPAEGRRLGGEVFVSFDRKAVRLLIAQGVAAELPG